jgi:hypothetical protein
VERWIAGGNLLQIAPGSQPKGQVTSALEIAHKSRNQLWSFSFFVMVMIRISSIAVRSTGPAESTVGAARSTLGMGAGSTGTPPAPGAPPSGEPHPGALPKIWIAGSLYLETEFSEGHLSQIIRGKRSPSLATMIKLAKVLDVRVADFFRNA